MVVLLGGMLEVVVRSVVEKVGVVVIDRPVVFENGVVVRCTVGGNVRSLVGEDVDKEEIVDR